MDSFVPISFVLLLQYVADLFRTDCGKSEQLDAKVEEGSYENPFLRRIFFVDIVSMIAAEAK